MAERFISQPQIRFLLAGDASTGYGVADVTSAGREEASFHRAEVVLAERTFLPGAGTWRAAKGQSAGENGLAAGRRTVRSGGEPVFSANETVFPRKTAVVS